jgi:hypothetical protein
MDPLDLAKNGGVQENSYHPHHQPGYPLGYPAPDQIQHNQPDRSNKFYDPYFMEQDNHEMNSNISSGSNGSRDGGQNHVESVIQHHKFERKNIQNHELIEKERRIL